MSLAREVSWVLYELCFLFNPLNIFYLFYHLFRRFSYGHLAQLKYVLPEAISVEKILIRDERTLCIKPDLQVALQLDAFDNSGKGKMDSGYSILKKMFHARILEFFKTHPEVPTSLFFLSTCSEV